jgi:hypothetical protein
MHRFMPSLFIWPMDQARMVRLFITVRLDGGELDIMGGVSLRQFVMLGKMMSSISLLFCAAKPTEQR